MKIKTPLLFCALALARSTSHAAPVRKLVPKGATSFAPKAQKFAVWLPTKPEHFQQTAKATNGAKVTVFGFTVDSKEISYLVLATPLAGIPKGEMGDLDVQQKSFLKSSGGTLKKREDIQLNGFAGRELNVASAIGRAIRVRIFITPKSQYFLMAQGEQADTKKQSAQINRFFDSFRILPR